MPEKHSNIVQILDNIADYLQYRVDEGSVAAEVNPETVKALGLDIPTAGKMKNVTPHRPEQDPRAELEQLAKVIENCRKCSLGETRTKSVPGQGSFSPEIMFVGEAPGADEDREGIAFIGRAGQLLTKMIEAMGYAREEVFIGNILKCRPPDNRTPAPDEMETCLPYLKQQITLLKPKVIIALGATAVKGLLDIKTGITKIRGTWMLFEGIDLMPTYHPAYLLRNPAAKKEVWKDLKEALKFLGRTPPSK